MTIRRRPPAMVEGLRNARRSLGDGSVLGRTRIATPPKPQPRPQPVTVIPAAAGGVSAPYAITAVFDDQLPNEDPWTVEFVAEHMFRASLSGDGKAIIPPNSGVAHGYVKLTVTDVAENGHAATFKGHGVGFTLKQGDLHSVSWDAPDTPLPVAGSPWMPIKKRFWQAQQTLTVEVRGAALEDIRIEVGFGLEDPPGLVQATFSPDIPLANLLFDGDPERQGASPLNQIADWSGNNNHSTTGMSLTHVADVLDGKAVWRNGNQSSSTSGVVEIGAGGTGSAHLWVFVAKASSLSTGRGHLLGRHTSNATTSNYFYQVNETLRSSSNLISGNILDTGWHVMTILQASSAAGPSRIWLDETEVVASGDQTGGSPAGRRQLMRNTFNPSGAPWVGDVARILGYGADGMSGGEWSVFYLNEVLPAVRGVYPSLPS